MEPPTKIIFFVESPFNERDNERFGIEILQQNGFAVEVWDFTPFLHPRVHEEAARAKLHDYRHCVQIPTKSVAQAAIASLSRDCLIVCLIGYSTLTYPLYRALTRAGHPYAVCVANALPQTANRNGTFGRATRNFQEFLSKIKTITPRKLTAFLAERWVQRWPGIQPATLVLAGGEKSTACTYPIGSHSETLWLHALDYDIYLRERQREQAIDERTAVFLDEYMPFHPDYLHRHIAPPVTAAEYYSTLRKVFDLVESHCGVSVVIAAHPSSQYHRMPDYFDGRSVIKGRTAELVRTCRLVLLHTSTSVNFAVLFQKPLLFVTTDQLEQSYLAPWIHKTASVLGKRPINIDRLGNIDWNQELSMDRRAYADYRQAYIKKSGSPELPFWQIFANHLKHTATAVS